MTRVLGVDACKRGWVGITKDEQAYFGPTIGHLVGNAEKDGELDVIAIDIPIGLPSRGGRAADGLARSLVGGRSSSVFSTPVRAALSAETYAEANALNREATGRGISQQAFALRIKILEVDRWVPTTATTVIEVHPEVCFATMAGQPLHYSKSTWSGIEERRHLLAEARVTIPAQLGQAGEMAGVDDVPDADAASWTAARWARGTATSHPAPPEQLDEEHPAAIWS